MTPVGLAVFRGFYFLEAAATVMRLRVDLALPNFGN